ncbi:BamA/TamA family outer membrane protein [Steroidobacter sp.]|uniref:BamA/TamA family outer membrane protein n=1 Tax=Steroidobacter sp. TaxID=1978227 RepID=UPI001A4E1D95|nr:BamA/TamA family outer membrane protein [Steroidobacter sp.]MBL8267940.1 BamA/TamA family outer membrane protein [Steroidobacter sp.]
MKRLAWIAATAATSLCASASYAESTDSMVAMLPGKIAIDQSKLPTDADLEKRGARIGHIYIQVDDVFENTLSLSAPYRLANGLHISTHDETVRQQLLFRSGEPFHRRVLDETARLLRDQRYLNEASVTPVRYNDDNTVDVQVRVHDVWTLSPGFSFGRKGGENNTRMKFEDTNFLGLGKQVSLARSSDVDRTSWQLAYKDPHLFGSWWALSTAYSSMSDGSEQALALTRPFYALDSRWSANLSASDQDSAVSRYSLGKRIERFNMQERQFDVGGGLSSGLHDGWTMRYLGGFRYDARSFATRTTEPGVAIPDDRTLAYPWVGIEVIEDNYLSTRNLDQIGRTEDVYLGRSARLEAGFASTAFGSTRDAFILNGTLQSGADLNHERYLINTLNWRGRFEGGELNDAVLDANSRFYLRQSERSVFFASVTASLTSNLDPERQLLLGGDNGLRGYPLRYQAGTTNALVTLEERFYSSWQPLKLFNVGAAVFFDAGRSWGQDNYAVAPAGWLKDVGVGLRLGSARSGLGNVLHIDLAMPLDRSNDIQSLQLLIETRKSF